MSPEPRSPARLVTGERPAAVMLARSPFAAGKTRLTGALPPDAAAALRAAILRDTIAAALATGWPLHVHVTPAGDLARLPAWFADDPALRAQARRVQWHAQAEGDLGARMIAAIRETLGAGHDVVALVGSDIPDLPGTALCEAASALAGRPSGARVVFGPALDGGFYLVAATEVSSLAHAFGGITWSQPSVLADVTARLVAAGVEVATVTAWRDLDAAADLAALIDRPGASAPRTRAAASRTSPLQ